MSKLADWRAQLAVAVALAAFTAFAFALPPQTALSSATHKYHLGHRATAAQIAGWNTDVLPDGTGLPDGHGSVAQGGPIYDAKCAACHGPFGQSNAYQSLAEVKAKLNYAPTLYDYINRAMPFPDPKTLTPNQVYAVSAYVLNLLGIVPANFVANKHTLPKVKMPNRKRLKPYAPMMHVTGVTPDTHNTECMHDCKKTVKVTSRLPPGFVQKMYGNISDNFRRLKVMDTLGPPPSSAPASAASTAMVGGSQLIRKYGCVACHSVDHKIVGPAFRDVAAKYRDDKGAEKYLIHKIRNGGSGVWGSIPMPPQKAPSDVDLHTIVQWVLSLKSKQ